MHILILSDLHLGKGRFLRNGQLNLLEDFYEDEKFFEYQEK
jgi:metallophosphoesterase superfamily enzyme